MTLLDVSTVPERSQDAIGCDVKTTKLQRYQPPDNTITREGKQRDTRKKLHPHVQNTMDSEQEMTGTQNGLKDSLPFACHQHYGRSSKRWRLTYLSFSFLAGSCLKREASTLEHQPLATHRLQSYSPPFRFPLSLTTRTTICDLSSSRSRKGNSFSRVISSRYRPSLSTWSYLIRVGEAKNPDNVTKERPDPVCDMQGKPQTRKRRCALCQS